MKITQRPQRALIYTRKSNDPTGEGVNVATQADRCRQLAADLGMAIVEPVLTDNDISAYSGRPRPGFRRLLEILAAGEADAVIVWHSDRLYRQPRDLEPLVDIVEKTGQKIHAVTHGPLDLSTPTGVMLARIMAAVNAQYVAHGIENMKDRKRRNREAGIQNGGPRTFGYQAVTPKAKGQKPDVPKVNEQEAKLIREAAQAVLARAADPESGLTLTGICRAWNERKISTPRGKTWSTPVLRGVLISPRIAGRVAHKGEDVGPAQWEAIIDYDTWLALRTVLTDPARSAHLASADARAPKYLGSGLYRCGRPGCGAIVRPGGARAGQRQQYRCTASAHLIRTAAPVDEYVTRKVIEKMTEIFNADTTEPEDRGAVEVPTQLTDRHNALTTQLASLTEEFADADEVDHALYRARARKLTEKIKAVEDEIADAATAAAAANQATTVANVIKSAMLATVEDTAAAWETYTLDERRKIVAELFTVTLLPGRRGRPAGVAAGGLDPNSVRIEPKLAAPAAPKPKVPHPDWATALQRAKEA